ncbi:MAG: branched-chain amino acid ABC transporter permease [Bacteroidales bacterium]|jgi:branched-chain amino acid transport system permease protein|nr:branched-chain amino acid ABC transporter permease [Bacteroidales bacterium]
MQVEIIVQILINIILLTSMYLLVANSFSTIYTVTKFFHIAHAITITSSAYFTYFFSQQLHYSHWIAVPMAIICASTIGLLSEIVIYKPLRRRNASPLIFMIASLGIYIVLQNIVSMIWGDDIKSIRLGEVKVGNEFLGAYIADIQIISIIVISVLFITSIVFLSHSRIGRNIQAVASNPELSNIMGISSDKVILSALVIGSSLAAVAGILIAFDTDINPTMGFNWLLYGVVAMIIGGIGSTWGLLGGALLLSSAQNLSAYFIGSQWMNAVAYILLILFLLAKPLGFSGKRLKKVEI